MARISCIHCVLYDRNDKYVSDWYEMPRARQSAEPTYDLGKILPNDHKRLMKKYGLNKIVTRTVLLILLYIEKYRLSFNADEENENGKAEKDEAEKMDETAME